MSDDDAPGCNSISRNCEILPPMRTSSVVVSAFGFAAAALTLTKPSYRPRASGALRI